MGVMHIADIKAGSFTTEAARAKSRERPLMA
jgi:hypothetical protein